MTSFLVENNITHAIILYPRDGYTYLSQVAKHSPTTQIWGLQVLMGVDKDSPTNLKSLTLDAGDPFKPLCKGIKIASHRGWWDKDGVVDSGFDYGSQSRALNKILNQLPDDSIVSMHLQGDPIFNSASIPQTVATYAYKYPHLKFIMNHCGDYGQGGLSNKPSKYLTVDKQGNDNLFPAFRYAHHHALIQAAITYANLSHNIYLDSSVLTPTKLELLESCDRWGLGSDYPFQKKSDLFIKEEKKAVSKLGATRIEKMYKDTLHWLTTPCATLLQEKIDTW